MWRLIKLEVMKNSQVMVTMKKHKKIMMTSDQNKNLGVIKHLEFMEIQKKQIWVIKIKNGITSISASCHIKILLWDNK